MALLGVTHPWRALFEHRRRVGALACLRVTGKRIAGTTTSCYRAPLCPTLSENKPVETIPDTPDVSLIIPVYDEEACVSQTVEEAYAVLSNLGLSFEILAIDDGSSDGTPSILKNLATRLNALRVWRLTPHSGQSAALSVGFRHAQGDVIVLMDADGQNDPADIPRLLDALKACDVCCGYRVRRHDRFSRRVASRVANGIRNRVLGEDVRDTGCTLKAIRVKWVQELPMWRGLHRFLPALLRMRGATISQIPVHHRPRAAGRSKYTNWGRLREALADLWGVRWMQRRYNRFHEERMA